MASVRVRRAMCGVALAVAVAGCGSDDPNDVAAPADVDAPTDTAVTTTEVAPADTEEDAIDELFPDVIGATASFDGDTWTISATLSSPYDTPERYADAWRVIGPDGSVYGERILTHDHAAEQPFTRSESGIEIPDDVAEVTIEGRDQISGYGGETFVLTLER